MCNTTVCGFLSAFWTYPIPGGTGAASTENFARWVSYQSNLSPYCGNIPVSLIVTQWGLETCWGDTFGTYNNPANQAGGCCYPTCGLQPNGSFVKFCDLNAGVKSYSQLLIKGYPHVAQAYGQCGQPGYGVLSAATQALGQGYYDFQAVSDGFCGGPASISSSTPRLWDQAGYNDGNGAGSGLLDTINANTCLSNLNFVQTTDPQIPDFPSTYLEVSC